MTLGDIVKQYRIDNDISMKEFANRCSLSKGYISMLENNINPRNNKPIAPTLPSIQKIANGMRIETDLLLKMLDRNQEISLKDEYSISNIFPIEKKHFPLLEEIACDEPIHANEDRESYIMAGTDIKADFCVKAKGNSMINARILDGDIVFIRKDEELVDGQIYAITIDNDVLLKRIYYDKENDIIQLVSENPEYKPRIYTREQLNHIHILGKAVAFQSDVI